MVATWKRICHVKIIRWQGVKEACHCVTPNVVTAWQCIAEEWRKTVKRWAEIIGSTGFSVTVTYAGVIVIGGPRMSCHLICPKTTGNPWKLWHSTIILAKLPRIIWLTPPKWLELPVKMSQRTIQHQPLLPHLTSNRPPKVAIRLKRIREQRIISSKVFAPVSVSPAYEWRKPSQDRVSIYHHL